MFEEMCLNELNVLEKVEMLRNSSTGILKQNSKNGPGRVWDFVGCDIHYWLKLSGAEHGSP